MWYAVPATSVCVLYQCVFVLTVSEGAEAGAQGEEEEVTVTSQADKEESAASGAANGEKTG